MQLLAVLGAVALTLTLAPATERAKPAATLIAAGDVAACDSAGDEQTARLLRGLRGTVAVLGDAVYPEGSDADFRGCYAPSWGRERARTRPAVGNHEYLTPGARGYFRYFGAAAGRPGDGWYAYRLATWRVIVLNTNCSLVGCGAASRQYRWLRSELRRHRATCSLAYGHHPRFSSGPHGNDASVAPLWRLLHAARVDVVLAGHDHDYERFAPLTPGGRVDVRRGIRSFVVGTGGKSLYPILFPLAASRSHSDRTLGVLVLRLLPGRYTWRFVPVPGSDFRDEGRASCR